MTGEPDLTSTLRSALGDLSADVTIADSGAVSIVVKAPGRDSVAIDATPDRTQWGVSMLVPDSSPFTGHDQVAGSLEEALAITRDLLSSPDW